jgi:hypothetical protein
LSDPQGIVETWDPQNGATATIKFKCLWDDRYQLVQDLVGTWKGTPPSSVIRVPPFRYPDSPNLFCSSIQSIEPFGKPTIWSTIGLPWITRKYAIVTATFSVPHWDFSGPDAYTKITFNASGEFLTVPETSTHFGDGTPTNSPIGILIPQIEISVERNRMPYLPVAAMASCVGRVNSAAYTIAGYVFQPGYLLFSAGQSNVQADASGQISYSQEYKFLYRSVQWNYFLHPAGTGFQPVTDLAGNPPYDSTDFSVLP